MQSRIHPKARQQQRKATGVWPMAVFNVVACPINVSVDIGDISATLAVCHRTQERLKVQVFEDSTGHHRHDRESHTL